MVTSFLMCWWFYMPLAQGGDEDRLDGVQAVLGLVEDDAGGRAEHVVRRSSSN